MKNYRVRIEQRGNKHEFSVGSFAYGLTFAPGRLSDPHDFKILCDSGFQKNEIVWHQVDGLLV